MLAVDWRNPVDSLDVNNDRKITAFDALAVINELNLNGVHALTLPKPTAAPFLDPTGNQQVSAFDALAVIDFLNRVRTLDRSLAETAGRVVSEQSITITAGNVPAGTRLYQLKLTPQFDTSSASTAGDVFSVYLIDPSTRHTIIDAGSPGSSLFSLTETGGVTRNGLVHWDGSLLTIDLSAVTFETVELRLQLLSLDPDSGSRVIATPWTNVVDPAGTPGTPGTLRGPAADPGESVDLTKYTQLPGLTVEIENIAYQSSTGKTTAEVRLRNNSAGTVTNGVFTLPGLATGVTPLNASGTANGSPYWSFASIIGPAGLTSGAVTNWLKVELTVPSDQPLSVLPEVLGYSSPAHLQSMNVFTGKFTAPGEIQAHTLQLNSPGKFLVRSQGPFSVAPTLSVDNGGGAVLQTPMFTNPSGVSWAVTIPFSGQYLFSWTAVVPGDFSFAVLDLEAAPELQLQTEYAGTFDPRRATQVFRYYGRIGESLLLQDLLPESPAGHSTWQMYLGQDVFLRSPTYATNTGPGAEFEFDRTGWYYLVHTAPPAATGPTAFRFATSQPEVATTPVTLNTPIAATFDKFGERQIFSFSGALDQTIVFTGQVPFLTYGDRWLEGPRGEHIDVIGSQPVTLRSNGTWQLVIRQYQPGIPGNGPVTVSFRILNVADLPSIGDGAVLQGTTLPGEPRVYRVPVASGEQLTLSINTPVNVNAVLYGPTSAYVPTRLIDNDHTYLFSTNAAGTHVLWLGVYDAITPGTLDFTLHKTQLSAPVTNSGFGTEYSGVVVPGGSFQTTFTGSAGTPILIDSLTNTFTNNGIDWVLKYTEGGADETIYTAGYHIYDRVLTLPRSGAFTLIGTSTNSTNANYGFRVLDLTSVPALPNNPDFTSAIKSGRNKVYKLDARAHDTLFVDSGYGYSASNYWNAEIATPTYRSSLSLRSPYTVSALESTYLIVRARTLPAGVTFQGIFTSSAEPLPLGSVVSGSLPADSLGKLYKFTVPADQIITVDQLTNSGYLRFRVFGQNDLEMVYLVDLIAWKFLRPGDYYVLLAAEARTTDYSFIPALLPTAATAINFGQTYDVSVAPGEVEVFTFHGTAGQSVLIDGLDPQYQGAPMMLMEDSFSVDGLLGNWPSYNTGEPILFSLDKTAEYKLIVGGKAGDFHFRVLDIENLPALISGTQLTGTMPAGGATRIWRFHLNINRPFLIENRPTALHPFLGTVSLYGPNSAFAYDRVTGPLFVRDFQGTSPTGGDFYIILESTDVAFDFDLRLLLESDVP